MDRDEYVALFEEMGFYCHDRDGENVCDECGGTGERKSEIEAAAGCSCRSRQGRHHDGAR